jgi:methyl-accepting chemotaxis protein
LEGIVTIRNILLGSYAVLAAMLVGFAVVNGLRAAREVQASAAFLDSNSTEERLLAAAAALAIERGLSNAPLHAPDALPVEKRAEIAQERANADAATRDGVARLRSNPSMAGSSKAVDELEQSYREFANFRQKVDEALSGPMASRPADIVDQFAPTVTTLIDRINKLRMTLEALTQVPSADLAQLVQLRHVTALMAEEAGRERAVFGGNIAQRRPFSRDDVRALSEHRGQVQLAWSALDALRQRSDLPARLEEAIAAIDREFMHTFGELRASVLARAEDGNYPLTGREWVDRSGSALATILRLSAEAGNVARSAAEAAASDNRRQAIIYLALMIAAIAVAGCGFAMMLWRVVRPLDTMAAVLGRLATDRNVEIPNTKRADEIGEMARAAQTFKDGLIRMEKLEAEQKEAERRSAAERRVSMQKLTDEFEAAIGGIVKAAVLGDFSKRVSLEGKDGFVLNIGTAMNALCENVASVMDDLAHMFGALADGDFSRRITADYHGVFGQIKNDANSMAQRIASTIFEIKAVGREVSNAASEISASTTDLSQRTEEQAASLEETSASMEEMAATVKRNAENARQADRLTSGSREVADRGGQVVAKAVGAMARIEESSRKISDIIGVIDEIARQTNLLALNAAVEAARAGDAGRGFAVVASEVRSLAQRSSQAAKDIKDLITSSSSQVQEGVGLVNQAGTSLNEILASIKQVADIVAEIASASQEQSTGIDQVNNVLAQMDEATQQNSALVEENAASARTLEQQSETMNQKVAFFKLDDRPESHRIKTPIAASPVTQVIAKRVKKETASARGAAVVATAVNGRRGGPVGRTQAATAYAVAEDKDWREF